MPLDQEALTPADLVSKLTNADAEVKNAADQYNQLGKKEQSVLGDISQAGVKIDLQWPPEMAGAKASFDKALAAVNGKSTFAFPTSSSQDPSQAWITRSVNFSDAKGPHTQLFSPPGSSQFGSSTFFAALDISAKMAETYPPAHDPAFAQKLGKVIMDAETQAWNAATPAARQQIAEIEQVRTIRDEQRTASAAGKGESYVLYNIQARMYSYMAHRIQAGTSDADVNHCNDFTLKTLPKD